MQRLAYNVELQLRKQDRAINAGMQKESLLTLSGIPSVTDRSLHAIPLKRREAEHKATNLSASCFYPLPKRSSRSARSNAARLVLRLSICCRRDTCMFLRHSKHALQLRGRMDKPEKTFSKGRHRT